MKTSQRARVTLAAAGVLAATAAIPAPARALTVTVAGDDGAPVALGGPVTIRTMIPRVGIAPGAGEPPYVSATFAGPDGVAAAPAACGTGATRTLDYRGNGTYTVTVERHAASDPDCRTRGAAAQYRFAVAAGVVLTAPPGRVAFRTAGSSAPRPILVGATPNPGALAHEARVARDGAIAADGSIAGPSDDAPFDATAGHVALTVRAPGRYTVVARARGPVSATGQFFSPWSAPAQVVAVAPFDLAAIRLTDRRGPSYRIAGRLRERSARGRVAVACARGRAGGRFRRIGRARLSARAGFALRFALRRAGVYRLRLRFGGSETTAAGTVVRRIRVSRGGARRAAGGPPRRPRPASAARSCRPCPGACASSGRASR